MQTLIMPEDPVQRAGGTALRMPGILINIPQVQEYGGPHSATLAICAYLEIGE